MSITHKSVVYVGKYFKDSDEALSFLVDKGVFSHEQVLEIKQIGLEEFLDGEEFDGQTLNYYRGCGFVFGKKIVSSHLEEVVTGIQEAEKEWLRILPDVEPVFIQSVEVY